jgi:hypothetical protein
VHTFFVTFMGRICICETHFSIQNLEMSSISWIHIKCKQVSCEDSQTIGHVLYQIKFENISEDVTHSMLQLSEDQKIFECQDS